ncbi:MAG: isocitrate/isopropylmalate dehydrogenase family protein [Candidatus Lokiarchaeota archaeon]|nr:isocitrate/isopropylmalate dehydrogenase family protein [Candidatus Lokiarchaeota archaeon]
MKKICLIGGEGIGIEVVESASKVLQELAIPNVEIIEAHAGEVAEQKFGKAFPEDTRDAIDSSDAILFGATHQKARPVLGYLRFVLGNYANIRPCKLYKGINCPLKGVDDIDFVIIRENMESVYSVLRIGEGNIKTLVRKEVILNKKVHESVFNGSDGKFALKIITEDESRRIADLACKKTVERKQAGYPGKLTIVHKANVLQKTDGLFRDISYSIAQDYINSHNIQVDDYFVDDMARRLVLLAQEQDVLLTINEYGDILSDLGAELVGGLGIAPSACIGSDHPYFEPVHGSAPDIAGQGIANPLAALLSLQMLLEYLNIKEAKTLEHAIEEYFLLVGAPGDNWKIIPRDLVPKIYQEQDKFAKTEMITQKIISLLNNHN